MEYLVIAILLFGGYAVRLRFRGSKSRGVGVWL